MNGVSCSAILDDIREATISDSDTHDLEYSGNDYDVFSVR